MSHVELSAMNNYSMSDDEAFVGEEDALMGKKTTENSTKEEGASMEEIWMSLGNRERLVICLGVSLFLTFFVIMITTTVVSVVMGQTSIYLQDVYIPALDTYTSTANGTAPFNASIIVDLKYHRAAATDIGGDFEESELDVYYTHGVTPAVAYRIEAFSMGDNTTVHKIVAMEAPELPWEEAFRAVSAGSTVELVVELGKLRRSPKEYGSVLSAHVVVDASGHMVPEGPIGLTYITY